MTSWMSHGTARSGHDLRCWTCDAFSFLWDTPCTVVLNLLLVHLHHGRWGIRINSWMWSVVIPLKKIRNNINVLQIRMCIMYLFITSLTVRLKCSTICTFTSCSVEKWWTVFFDNNLHTCLFIEFLTLVHLKFDGRSHVFKHSNQSITHLFPSLAPQRYE